MFVRDTRDQDLVEIQRFEIQQLESARRRAASALAWTDVIDRRRPEPTDVEPVSRTTAEVAECACPDYCERDHEYD